MIQLSRDDAGLSYHLPGVARRSASRRSFPLVFVRELFLPISFILLSVSASAAQTDEIAEVKSVVESYTRAHASKDLPLYLSYFHPDFTGWYFGDTTTTTREDREAGLSHYFSAIEFIEYRPELEGIAVHGDVAIVHYTLHQQVRWSDGTEQGWREYWTDILVRDLEGVWRLRHDHGHRLE